MACAVLTVKYLTPLHGVGVKYFFLVQERELVGVRKENEVLKTEISSLKSQHTSSLAEVS